jgi:V/A-type H+/Na+-transporting ATPase subunit A
LDEAGANLNERYANWADRVRKAAEILRKGDEIGKRMEVVGEEGVALIDMILFLKSELYEFAYLQQNAFDKEDAYCPLERQIEMFRMIQKIFDTEFDFDAHDEARSFFLTLQNDIKNINFLPFQSERYRAAIHAVEQKIDAKTRTMRKA